MSISDALPFMSSKENKMRAAIKDRDTEKIRMLVEDGADPDIKVEEEGGLLGHTKGDRALHAACAKQDPTLVEMLLEAGADPDAKNDEGKPPISLSLFGPANSTEVLKVLLKGGADPNVIVNPKLNDEKAPLHEVIDGHADPEKVKLLLEAGANPDKKMGRGERFYGSTPLHMAAKQEEVEAVELLLDAGADPSSTDRNDHTPLHRVARIPKITDKDRAGADAVEIIEALIEAGADRQAENHRGETPLDLAKDFAENRKIVEEIQGSEMEPRSQEVGDEKSFSQDFLDAVKEENLRTIRELLSTDAKSVVQNPSTTTPLNYGEGSGEIAAADVIRMATQVADLSELDEQKSGSPDSDVVRLLKASQEADLQVIRDLLDRGVDPDVHLGERSLTPLLVATAFGRAEVVDLLLEAGSDPDFALDPAGKTALMIASTFGDREIVQLLLEAGADYNAESREGQSGRGNVDLFGATPLIYAVHGGHVEIVQMLQETASGSGGAGSDPNHPYGANRRSFALHHTAEADKARIAELLLQQGANLDQEDSTGRTPLEIAQEEENTAVAEVLDSHASTSREEKTGETEQEVDDVPNDGVDDEELELKIIEAAREGDLDELKQLIDAGADPSIGLAFVSTADAARLLLNAGADVSATPTAEGGTALHGAALEGVKEIVSILLDSGADPHLKNDHGKTPLHFAARENPEVGHLLLEAGADPDARDQDNKTPLHEAVIEGDSETVEVLLEADADPDARSSEERFCPIHFADSADKVQLLSAAGADLDTLSSDRETRLHELAAYSSGGDLGVVQALLEYGADPNARDRSGRTPLHRAAQNCSAGDISEVVELLLEYGADPTRTDKTAEAQTPVELAEEEGNEAAAETLRFHE